MASEKQKTANRRNALRSTGPRSAAGKRRSRGNAYRHGLSISLTLLPESRAEIEALAKLIADTPSLQISAEDAAVIALSDLEQQRVRAIKNAVITTAYRANEAARRGQHDEVRTASDQEAALAKCMTDVLPDLRRLERYARRAAALRDRTLRRIARRRRPGSMDVE